MCGGTKVWDRMLKGLVADEKRGMGCKTVQWCAKVPSRMLNGARCVKTRNGVCKDAATGEGHGLCSSWVRGCMMTRNGISV
jgi:hypothetical protein